MPTADRPPAGRRVTEGACIGACATAGWLVNDAVRFATSGQPEVFLALVPGSLVALAVGTLLGALAGRFRPLWAVYLAAGLTAFAAPLRALEVVGPLAGFGTHQSGAQLVIVQGKVLALWSLACVLAGLAPRIHWPAGRTATCLGVLGAIAAGFISRGQDPIEGEPPFWMVPAAGAIAALALGWPRLRYGGLATGAVVLVCALLTFQRGYPETRPSYWRDDLPPPASPAMAGPNLLLVVLDTVRAQSLAPYGGRRVTTPELDRWVREHATLHGQARSTSSFTLATHGSLFTGVLPAQHQAARLRPSAGRLSQEFPTLAERLRERGYQTAAIVSNHTYLHPQFGMDRGFEHFDTREGAFVERYLALAQLTGRTLWAGHILYRDAHSITGSALSWLERRRPGDPFFLMLNYLDAHTPYLVRAPHDKQFEDLRLVSVSGMPPQYNELAYERKLHYLDTQVARLLRAIEQLGLLDDTLIVITSDHGEAFGEHGFHEHCWTLYEEVVKVPLYVKPPGGRRLERDDRPIHSADVTWLVLDELGIPYERPAASAAPEAEWYRQIPMTEKYTAMAEQSKVDLDRDLVAWFEGGRKVIVSTHGTVEAYDLASDPLEQSPLVLSPEESERALARARAWWAAHPLSAEQTEVIPPDELARLRALGYAGEE
jgi:arylsulfatase A-like enzyme